MTKQFMRLVYNLRYRVEHNFATAKRPFYNTY